MQKRIGLDKNFWKRKNYDNKACGEESSLEVIQRNWPALSDWICEELYCSGLRIPKSVRNSNLWGKGVFEASDDEYLNLHAAALNSEPVDPFDNKDFIITSSARLASHIARFGIHQYASRKHQNSKKIKEKENHDFEKEKKGYLKNNSKNKENKDVDLVLDNESGKYKKIHKHWWSKYFDRQKKKKSSNNKENGHSKSIPLDNEQNNFEYLFYGSGNKVSPSLDENERVRNLIVDYNISPENKNKEGRTVISVSSVKSERRLFNLREHTNVNEFDNGYNGPNYSGNQVPNLYSNQFSGPYMQNGNGYGRFDTNTYVPLNIKTSVFAAYFAAEPIIVHFSKTIGRNRRVKYGQEIGVAEAFPRTLNNELSNIILSRCDGTISIIYQMKGMPIQATRMFLVITCNDGP
ncbi:hypothetical protein FG379_002861 [Cryptosporidium bovis]|uniref:uncharacterized protein n=1 Tax=Cryptosporidium bovis TaxID=310047 RepID=UPI003519FDCE|nr:hypothetical protein FG379_002861 [Cryptosporidium bovis]